MSESGFNPAIGPPEPGTSTSPAPVGEVPQFRVRHAPPVRAPHPDGREDVPLIRPSRDKDGTPSSDARQPRSGPLPSEIIKAAALKAWQERSARAGVEAAVQKIDSSTAPAAGKGDATPQPQHAPAPPETPGNTPAGNTPKPQPLLGKPETEKKVGGTVINPAAVPKPSPPKTAEATQEKPNPSEAATAPPPASPSAPANTPSPYGKQTPEKQPGTQAAAIPSPENGANTPSGTATPDRPANVPDAAGEPPRTADVPQTPPDDREVLSTGTRPPLGPTTEPDTGTPEPSPEGFQETHGLKVGEAPMLSPEAQGAAGRQAVPERPPTTVDEIPPIPFLADKKTAEITGATDLPSSPPETSTADPAPPSDRSAKPADTPAMSAPPPDTPGETPQVPHVGHAGVNAGHTPDSDPGSHHMSTAVLSALRRYVQERHPPHEQEAAVRHLTSQPPEHIAAAVAKGLGLIDQDRVRAAKLAESLHGYLPGTPGGSTEPTGPPPPSAGRAGHTPPLSDAGRSAADAAARTAYGSARPQQPAADYLAGLPPKERAEALAGGSAPSAAAVHNAVQGERAHQPAGGNRQPPGPPPPPRPPSAAPPPPPPPKPPRHTGAATGSRSSVDRRGGTADNPYPHAKPTRMDRIQGGAAALGQLVGAVSRGTWHTITMKSYEAEKVPDKRFTFNVKVGKKIIEVNAPNKWMARAFARIKAPWVLSAGQGS